MDFILANADNLIGAILAVLGAASAIARVTPTKADDAIVQRIYDFVHLLGLTKK